MFSFWKARMPNLHNGVEGLKSSLEDEDYEWAEKLADSNSKGLQKALDETNKAIEKRDRGESRGGDPDVENGINW